MGGGGPSIPQRNISQEWPQIKKLYGGQENQYLQFTQKDPLLAAAYPYALDQLSNVGQLTQPLQDLLGQLPDTFAGYQKELGGLIPGLQDLISSQQSVYSGLQPILQSQGALTPEQNRDVTQATRARFAAQGNVMGNQAIGQELLDRDQYRQQRFGTALNQALGLSGSIGNLSGQEAGIIGQQAGLTGAQAGITTGLTQGIQGLQTGALGNVLNTESTGVGSFSKLTNPILAYMSDLFSSNQNAAAAQSIAGANKSAGGLSGGLGAIGSIVGGVATAY